MQKGNKNMNKIDDPVFQKKLCSFFRHLSLYATFFMIVFFLAEVWGGESLIPSDVFGKVLVSYAIILGSGIVIRHIFTETQEDKK